MQSLTNANFGIVTAYVIPGAILVLGSRVQIALIEPSVEVTTVSGLLLTTLFALFAGMTCSAIRWLIVDTLHYRTSVRRVRRDFSQIANNLEVFRSLVEYFYQYYQFYSNSLVAGLMSYFVSVWNVDMNFWWHLVFWLWIVLFWLASRDSLSKYNRGIDQLACH